MRLKSHLHLAVCPLLEIASGIPPQDRLFYGMRVGAPLLTKRDSWDPTLPGWPNLAGRNVPDRTKTIDLNYSRGRQECLTIFFVWFRRYTKESRAWMSFEMATVRRRPLSLDIPLLSRYFQGRVQHLGVTHDTHAATGSPRMEETAVHVANEAPAGLWRSWLARPPQTNHFDGEQEPRRRVHYEVEDVDRAHQVPGGQELELLPDVGLGERGASPRVRATTRNTEMGRRFIQASIG